MVRSRAWRRHHLFRLKSQRNRYRSTIAKTPKIVGKVYRTPCACSCFMCGNQRKHHGINIQEHRASLLFTD